MAKTEREKELEQALLNMMGYADETFTIWESPGDKDMKVGKRLQAMAGSLKGYNATMDDVQRLVSHPAEQYICDACGWRTGTTDALSKGLSEIHKLHERLDVGGTVPAGTCPSCESFVYLETEETRLRDHATAMAKVLRQIDHEHRANILQLGENPGLQIHRIIELIGEEGVD